MVPSNVVYLSHNGLGDNLISIGALHYLLNFYQNVFFLCKDVYHENIKMFFLDEPRIQCVPIDSKNEEQSCIQTIQPAYYNYDIDVIICGCHKRYLQTKVNHPEIVKYRRFPDD